MCGLGLECLKTKPLFHLCVDLVSASIARFKMLNYRIKIIVLGGKLSYINSVQYYNTHMYVRVHRRSQNARAHAHITINTCTCACIELYRYAIRTYIKLFKSTCSLIRRAACLLDEQNVCFSMSGKDSLSTRRKIELNILKISK